MLTFTLMFTLISMNENMNICYFTFSPTCYSLCAWLFPFLIIYLIIPSILYIHPSAMQYAFFLNFMKIPFTDYSNFDYHKIDNKGRNFYLKVDDGIMLGAWHILPKTLSDKFTNSQLTNDEFESSLKEDNYPVMIYLHGNSFDRTGQHRCLLYNVLSKLDFHVIAIDYRGYGDSTGSTSEVGIIKDAISTYKYVVEKTGDNSIFVWGHSMGTGVATKAVMDMSLQGNAPVGLILESPFNNLKDVVQNHPLSTPFRWLPWFEQVFIQPMKNTGLDMSSDKRIASVSCPILMLHARDDHIIPYNLAEKLRKSAESAGRDVTFVEFENDRHFGHKYICKAEELPDIIRTFFEKCTPRKSTNPND